MAIIYINGNKYDVDISQNLLQNCLSLNIDVPYFCWHPELGSVGVCRLCAVKQYNNIHDKSGRMIMSCVTPTTANLIISTTDQEVQKFRKGIIELLMTNHPHDCPICEEGGNCHLQDMTVMTQHHTRRYIYSKRIHQNQYLGDFITHQMNRCIGCYRCVRYYKDYAGGTDFGVYGTSNNIYFGRFEPGDLENTNSGNLIDVCPTGVFTDKLSYQNYNRKWDLQHAPSICQHCNIGCNIIVGERYGKIGKIENRYHNSLNRYFLCDLGRFGYNYINTKYRIKNPIYFLKKEHIVLNQSNAIKNITNIIKKSNRIFGIGSIRSSIENNFSLKKLVGKKNFSNGLSEIENNCIQLIIDILKNSGIYIPSLSDIENYDVVLIIGEDITQIASRMDLSIRQLNKKKKRDNNHVQNIPEWHSIAMLNISNNNKKFIYIIHSHETKLDDVAALNYYGSIQEQEAFSFAISDIINTTSFSLKNFSTENNLKIKNIANVLLSYKKPLIISGSHSGSLNLIKAATNIAQGLKKLNKEVGLILLTPSSNSIGLGILSNHSVEYVFKKIINKDVDTLIILENDLYRYSMDDRINHVLKKVKNLIVFDHLITKTTKKSTMLFPICNFIESSGTIINYEGRAQRFFSACNPIVYYPKSCILEGWKWLYKIYFSVHDNTSFDITLDSVISEYTSEIELFKNIKNIAPNSKFRILNQKISRLPHRSSGRTAMLSHHNIHEPEQKKDNNTMFNFSMEGHQQPNYHLNYIPFTWSPGWNSIQSWNKYIAYAKNNELGIKIFKKNTSHSKYFFNENIIFNNIKKSWSIIPYYLLFGTEELSQYSSTIQKKFFKKYALINIKYKDILKIYDDSIIEFECLNHVFKLYVKFSYHFPSKTIGLPLGLPNIPQILLGKKVKNIRGIN